MAVKMIALKPFSFANRSLVAGDQLTAEDERQALLLEAIGRAKRDDGTEKRGYRRRDLRAEH